jgi:hypothetical protein
MREPNFALEKQFYIFAACLSHVLEILRHTGFMNSTIELHTFNTFIFILKIYERSYVE